MSATIFKNVPETPSDKAEIRLTIPGLPYEWYVMSAREVPDDDYYCYGLVNFMSLEYGYFSYNELISLGAEVDTEWVPCKMDIVASSIMEVEA